MACILDEPLEPYICEADWNCVECPNWKADTDNEYYYRENVKDFTEGVRNDSIRIDHRTKEM